MKKNPISPQRQAQINPDKLNPAQVSFCQDYLRMAAKNQETKKLEPSYSKENGWYDYDIFDLAHSHQDPIYHPHAEEILIKSDGRIISKPADLPKHHPSILNSIVASTSTPINFPRSPTQICHELTVF